MSTDEPRRFHARADVTNTVSKGVDVTKPISKGVVSTKEVAKPESRPSPGGCPARVIPLSEEERPAWRTKKTRDWGPLCRADPGPISHSLSDRPAGNPASQIGSREAHLAGPSALVYRVEDVGQGPARVPGSSAAENNLSACCSVVEKLPAPSALELAAGFRRQVTPGEGPQLPKDLSEFAAAANHLTGCCAVVGGDCVPDPSNSIRPRKAHGAGNPAMYPKSHFRQGMGMVLDGAIMPQYYRESVGKIGHDHPQGKKMIGAPGVASMDAVLKQIPLEVKEDPMPGPREQEILSARSAASRAMRGSPQVQAALQGLPEADGNLRKKRPPMFQPKDPGQMVREALRGAPPSPGQTPRHGANVPPPSDQVSKAITGVPLEPEANSRKCPIQASSERVAKAIYGVPATQQLPQREKLLPGQESHSVAKAINGIPLSQEGWRRGFLRNENSEEVRQAMQMPLRPSYQYPPYPESVPTNMVGAGPVRSVRERQSTSGPLMNAGLMVASPRSNAPVVQTDPTGLRLQSDRARLFHRPPPEGRSSVEAVEQSSDCSDD